MAGGISSMEAQVRLHQGTGSAGEQAEPASWRSIPCRKGVCQTMSELASLVADRQGVVAFETCRGWIGVVVTGRGIAAATLFRQSQDLALNELWERQPAAILLEAADLPELDERLRRYAAGEPVRLDDLALDLGACTPFQRQVLRTVQAIPRGQTWSYADVARAIGRPAAARAVGQVMARNPVPLFVPCHRVVASGGGLGGFGGPGGLVMKRALLDLERRRPV
jgi:methylated-DNA-[protein]-cysteine S-methyltransferase